MSRNLLASMVFGLFIIGLLPMSRLQGDYTFAVVLAFLAATAAIWQMRKLTIYWRFWLYLLVSFGLFFVANTFLTALPIVTYGDSAITGFRIGTIPIEDFAYNFALLTFFILTYQANIEE
jgi:lycopene cyclase domain-containing protein